jgi:CheY-like chemotaxis protein
MDDIRLLYVEDNDDLRATIVVLLEGDGRIIRVCATAEEALVALESDSFDVLVTDVSLPGLSGADLTRQAIGIYPNLWVILCSGYEFGTEVKRFGPRVRSIAKPFELEDLDRLLDEMSTAVRSARSELRTQRRTPP